MLKKENDKSKKKKKESMLCYVVSVFSTKSPKMPRPQLMAWNQL